jgi:lipoprotein NlpI
MHVVDRIEGEDMKPSLRFALLAVFVLWANLARTGEDAGALLARAQAAAAKGDSEAAVELATAAIKQDVKLTSAYYLRGRERFRLGKVKESVADFDRYVELRPSVESRQWERGIANYYAEQYEKGAKQFELYQTFHNNDVENSVWRYLCMVPQHGIRKSRAVMLPIENDRRVPMMQVYELYRGNLKPDDVLAACKRDDPPPEVLAGRLFYAHLYLGLYYEVASQADLAAKYIKLAADEALADNSRINRYMWDVARIHAELMDKRAAGSAKERK